MIALRRKTRGLDPGDEADAVHPTRLGGKAGSQKRGSTKGGSGKGGAPRGRKRVSSSAAEAGNSKKAKGTGGVVDVTEDGPLVDHGLPLPLHPSFIPHPHNDGAPAGHGEAKEVEDIDDEVEEYDL